MSFVNNYNMRNHRSDINKCHFSDKNDNNYSHNVSTLENIGISEYNKKDNKLNKDLDYFGCYGDNYSRINMNTTTNNNVNHIHLKSILSLWSQNFDTRSSCHIHIQTLGVFINHHHDKSIRKTPVPKECFFDKDAFSCWETYFHNSNTINNRENDKFKLDLGQSSTLKRRNLHK